VAVLVGTLFAGEAAAEAYATSPSSTFQYCITELNASSANVPMPEKCYEIYSYYQTALNSYPMHAATLWRDAHGTGWRLALATQNWCAGLTSHLPQMPAGWNDQVSSLTMFDTTCALAPIYRDIGFANRIYDCGETSGNLDVAPGCSGFPSGVNDQMSSLILSS
jgi:hypothetical protein